MRGVSPWLVRALIVLALTNVVIVIAILGAASLGDRAACNRTRVTRESLLALRDYAISATAARREAGLAEVYSNPGQSRIDLKAAREFQAEANRVTVKQNACNGPFP